MGSTRRGHVVRGALALVVVAVVGIVGAGCASAEPPGGSGGATSTFSVSPSPAETSSSAASPVATACGATQLAKMTLRQKLAQLIVVGVTGAADAQAIVEKEQIGGIFVGSWTDKSILTSGAAARISRTSPVPLMVTVDQEGGRVSRLSSLGIDSPSARELAAARTPQQVQTLAASIGKQLRRLGITVDFAPSVDVSNEPDDEVIGDRSFSNDPAVVTEYGSAFAAGLASAGITPVYKHFPGHGHGSGDSHLGVVVTPPLSSLERSDLVPYKTLLQNPGKAAVMVGHLIVPGLTGPETPASISPRAIGMLRSGQPYGGPPFDGVVFSDDLSGMAAISARYPIEEAAPMAIRAGSDIALWLSTDRVSSVLDALQRQVASKRLTEDRVDRSVVRILRSKGVLTC
ncbi:glycoside hydrolase family 3 protein [Gordonia sp. ABSL11-1]|uniref:glycoside hydrolase family 3 N-terminal domain-containing protein n=1 Tax=Gordonia sp. ABSL11-1 TaxID=3053924 RepID=UPI002573ACD8|nr:glycoside hydrolase family 3 protein [Gordonia sp. ABSL11-1]MDL9946615.1 glycoside hydrolase family 3 protein [Gordonia sp. ABSL11-1]